MIEGAHEFAEVNVAHARVSPDHEHILVVIRLGRAAEIGRSGHDRRVNAERIHEDELVVNVLVAIEPRQDLAEKVFEVAWSKFRPDSDDRVPAPCHLGLDASVERLVEQEVAKRVAGLGPGIESFQARSATATVYFLIP